jgi:hypothetical protein
LVGRGFTYVPDEGCQGQDQFVVTVSGKIKKKRGTSAQPARAGAKTESKVNALSS